MNVIKKVTKVLLESGTASTGEIARKLGLVDKKTGYPAYNKVLPALRFLQKQGIASSKKEPTGRRPKTVWWIERKIETLMTLWKKYYDYRKIIRNTTWVLEILVSRNKWVDKFDDLGEVKLKPIYRHFLRTSEPFFEMFLFEKSQFFKFIEEYYSKVIPEAKMVIWHRDGKGFYILNPEPFILDLYERCLFGKIYNNEEVSLEDIENFIKIKTELNNYHAIKRIKSSFIKIGEAWFNSSDGGVGISPKSHLYETQDDVFETQYHVKAPEFPGRYDDVNEYCEKVIREIKRNLLALGVET